MDLKVPNKDTCFLKILFCKNIIYKFKIVIFFKLPWPEMSKGTPCKSLSKGSLLVNVYKISTLPAPCVRGEL